MYSSVEHSQEWLVPPRKSGLTLFFIGSRLVRRG